MKRTITHILPTETVGQNNTPKAGLVLEEVADQYPNTLQVDVWGDKTERMKEYSVGDVIELEYNTKVREHNGRWYNSISAWSIKKVEGQGEQVDDDDNLLPF